MDPVLETLVARFPRLPEAEAAVLLRDRYGTPARHIERLDTERDDTFRFVHGERIRVLKVAHPHDTADIVDLQVQALLHATEADPTLPVQRLVRTRDGSLVTVWGGRVARVFEWTHGTLARGLAPTPAQLRAAGTMLGRLSLALADFDHPAADRELAWDLQRLPVLREIATPETVEVIDRYERLVVPHLSELPHQVIHNDFHPGNLLVDPDDPDYVTGILDFGDTVRSARVNDLGVALAYLSMGSSPWEAAAPFLQGFESVVPLLEVERALLPHLVAGRLVQRVLLNGMLERDATLNSTRGGL